MFQEGPRDNDDKSHQGLGKESPMEQRIQEKRLYGNQKKTTTKQRPLSPFNTVVSDSVKAVKEGVGVS